MSYCAVKWSWSRSGALDGQETGKDEPDESEKLDSEDDLDDFEVHF